MRTEFLLLLLNCAPQTLLCTRSIAQPGHLFCIVAFQNLQGGPTPDFVQLQLEPGSQPLVDLLGPGMAAQGQHQEGQQQQQHPAEGHVSGAMGSVSITEQGQEGQLAGGSDQSAS